MAKRKHIPVLRIAFIMPEASARPIGGAKAVYRYADELAAMGHSVAVVHPQTSLLASIRRRLDRDPGLFRNACPGSEEAIMHYGANSPRPDPHPWYRSRPEVMNLVVPDLAEESLPFTFDVVIATNFTTVPWIARYAPRFGRKIYFLLDYESYMLGTVSERAMTRRTLTIDWPIIVSSPAVRDFVESIVGRHCHLVSRAIDTELFQSDLSIDSPERTLIGFPARSERTKRTFDAVRALELAREGLGSIDDIWCFGYERLSALPPWVTQHVAPSDQELSSLYNHSRLFLVPSQWEGFGQPGAEAMACGAALISTRNGGIEAYAVDRESAILCSVGMPAEMAAAITLLTSDDDLRRKIARQGRDSMRCRVWTAAAAQFEELLLRICTEA